MKEAVACDRVGKVLVVRATQGECHVYENDRDRPVVLPRLPSCSLLRLGLSVSRASNTSKSDVFTVIVLFFVPYVLPMSVCNEQGKRCGAEINTCTASECHRTLRRACKDWSITERERMISWRQNSDGWLLHSNFFTRFESLMKNVNFRHGSHLLRTCLTTCHMTWTAVQRTISMLN